MIGEKVVGKTVVTLSEVEDMLSKRLKGVEPKFEQEATLKYVTQFKKLKAKDAISLRKKLSELDFVEDEEAVKVVDLMPDDEQDINVIFAARRIPLTPDQAVQILELVKKAA